jgi:hypothetical protein
LTDRHLTQNRFRACYADDLPRKEFTGGRPGESSDIGFGVYRVEGATDLMVNRRLRRFS